MDRQFEIAQTLFKISTSLMRDPTKGQVIKQRVWCFVEALLTSAEDSPDFAVHWETDKGTGNPIFVVNTQRRFLLSLTGLKSSELTEVIKSLESLKIWEDRRLKRGKGSQIGHFALKLWSRDTERNREQFEKVWEADRPEKSKALEANQQKSEQFDWQNICKTMLKKQKEMTTNRLMNNSEMIFDINQIHVPLALVERKKQDKHQGDDSPDKSHSYKPEYEEIKKFEYEEFLAVLKSATNNKVAIIGEPGAGKTTLLQRIAFWILENTNDLAIWIPLGNLPTTGINFKDYLLDNWLQNAISNITPEIKADFDKQLTAGKVWLLLDGVDEMATSGNALSFINNWLPAWSQNLHFVLTCRLNIWEANPYLLNGFQTYRTLEFSQKQVKDFINNCFQQRRGARLCAPTNPALGEQLQQALNQPGKERIKDLVRNPLRLMLLCSTWHSLDGKLPDTKAELYQHFVDEVYRWKKDELRITPQQKKQLNTKLKELALAAIDKEENRFSLRQKFVETVLGEWDDELFQFALKVGWLNRVGVDAKNLKPVYAFFHPTFEEYFAALAIKDWGYFLNHVPDNPAQGIYRIFEPQWKEVFLLWLGREDVGKVEKEAFIQKLVEFEDGCGDFYKYRAYFLAAAGIAEFWDCKLADKIVDQVLEWGFSYLEPEQVRETAKKALKESNRTKTISKLINLLCHSLGNYSRQEAAFALGQIDYKNQKAIDVLVELLNPSHNNFLRLKAADSLLQIDPNNEKLFNALIDVFYQTKPPIVPYQLPSGLQIDSVQLDEHNSQDAFICYRAAYKLLGIDPENQEAFNFIAAFTSLGEAQSILAQATGTLKPIPPENKKIINVVSQKEIDMMTELLNCEEEHLKVNAAIKLLEINTGNSEALNVLINQLHIGQSLLFRLVSAQFLLENIDSHNQESLEVLIDGVCQGDRVAANSLIKVIQGNFFQIVVSSLKDHCTNRVYQINSTFDECGYQVIWHCAQNMTYPDFHKAWHSPHLQLPGTGA